MSVSCPSVFARNAEITVAANSAFGGPADEPRVFFLQKGCAVREDGSGKALSVIWPGELIVYPAECRALTDCRCLAAPQALLEEALSTDLELARWLTEQGCRRNRELHQRIDWFVNRRAEDRILSVLWEQTARAVETTGAGAIPLAQLQVAQLAGATRETASMLLHRLRERGLIDYRRRSILVPEPTRLEQHLRAALGASSSSSVTSKTPVSM